MLGLRVLSYCCKYMHCESCFVDFIAMLILLIMLVALGTDLTFH